MKRIRKLLLLATLLAPLSAFAASLTCPSGSLCIGYVNAAGNVNALAVASATIPDATATQFLTWCKARYAATAGASTNQGCFNTWANDWFNQTITSMNATAQAAAADTAAKAVVPPAIVPAQ